MKNKNSTNLVLTILGTTAGTSIGLRAQATSNNVNQIWDFEHTKIGRQLGIFCGTQTPASVIRSSGEAIMIRHHSNEGNQAGFGKIIFQRNCLENLEKIIFFIPFFDRNEKKVRSRKPTSL